MIVNPTWANFDLGRALQEAGQPAATLAGGQTNLALQNLARRQYLSDVGGARGFEMGAAGMASQRRMAEMAESRRLDLMEKLAGEGVPNIKPDDDVDALNNKAVAFRQQKARGQIAAVKTQVEAARNRQQAAMDQVHNIAGDPAIGNPELRRQALRTALADPASRYLPDDVRKDLETIANSNDKDPVNAVQQAVQRMQQFWGSKGVLTGTRMERAASFYQAYMGALRPAATQEQQAKLVTAMKDVDDANKEAQALTSRGFSYIEGAAGLLPDQEIGDHLKSFGTTGEVPDRVAMTKGLEKPAPPQQPTPATPAPSPAGPTASDIVQDQGLAGLARAGVTSPNAPAAATVPMGAAANALLGPIAGAVAMPGSRNNLMEAGRNIAAVPTVARNLMFGSNAGQPISPQALLANRVKLDLAQDPNPNPIKASPDELAKAHQLNASLHGITPEASQQNFAAAMADPAKESVATASLNALIKMVRAQSAGMPIQGAPLPANSLGTSFPASAPVAATANQSNEQ